MPDLVLLIGIPGSGKSFLAAQLQERCQRRGCVVVSTDRIRADLFGDEAVQGDWRLVWRAVGQEFRQAAELAEAGLTIYDATNARRRSRREVIGLARQAGFQRVFGLWLNPPLDLCLERNRQRSRRVPEVVLRRMHQQLRSSPPKRSEGLNLLLHRHEPDLSDWLTWIEVQFNQGQFGELNSEASRLKPDHSGSSTGIAPVSRPEPNS